MDVDALITRQLSKSFNFLGKKYAGVADFPGFDFQNSNKYEINTLMSVLMPPNRLKCM